MKLTDFTIEEPYDFISDDNLRKLLKEKIMSQGPEVTMSEEDYMEEIEIEQEVQGLEEILSCFDPELDEEESNELSELIYWMNEQNMFEEQSLSYESVIKSYNAVQFIKDCSKNDIKHGYRV